MKRRLIKPGVHAHGKSEATTRVSDFLDHGKRKRDMRPVPKRATPLEAAIADARSRADSGDWLSAPGMALVGLYSFCHEEVYGVTPIELDEKAALRVASRMASAMVKKYFGSDTDEAVEFIKWTWMREREREEWAAQNGKTRGRVGYRLQFSSALLTDYRVALSRKQRRG